MEYSEQIFSILSDVYGVSPWKLEQIEADLKQTNVKYYDLKVGSELVGFLALQDLAGELEITQIAVKKAYQSRGFANQLMDYLSERTENIFLEVRDSNQVARALYEKYGFEQVGRRKKYYQNPCEDAILMVRKGV